MLTLHRESALLLISGCGGFAYCSKIMYMKKVFILGLAGLLAAGICSCSREGIDGVKPLEKDQSFYVNVDVVGTDAMTRAGDARDYSDEEYDSTTDPKFDKGNDTYNENGIRSIYFIFYDKKGDRVATTQVRKDNAESGTYEDGASENSFYQGVVQIDVKHGSLPPAYVMAFINPITSTNFEINPDFATLKDLQKTTRPKIIDDNNYFAMSKSVYYGTDRVTGDEHQKIVATPLVNADNADAQHPQQLFPSKEAAEAALGGDSMVKIYVERYAAKVNFSLSDVAKRAEVKVDDKKLTFVPEFWAVNAYESETYVTKSFLQSDGEGQLTDDSLTWSDLNKALGGTSEKASWYWNSEEHHRCYWAQSPAYYMESYPRVADDILDTQSYAAGGYALGYYSYNEMKANANEKLNSKARNLFNPKNDGGWKDEEAPIYARENTVAGAALQAAYEDPYASPKAAIASVALVGHYEVDGKAIGDKNFFYVMGNATNGYTFFENYDEMLNYFVTTTIPFSLDAFGYDTFFDYNGMTFTNPDYKSYFKIEHPKMTVREDLVIDSRFVTIQLDPAKFTEEPSGIFASLDGKYTEVTIVNVNDVNRQMLYAAGTVQAFQGGKAYFTIPIKHLGFYRDGNLNKGKNANDKNFDWTKVQSGDFGLVRNHIYTVIVDDIKGLGNAIPDPNDPIVPPTDPEEYFIGARLIILNWAVVPAQHVTL